MGRCKSLGLLKLFLSYASQLTGASILIWFFHILSSLLTIGSSGSLIGARSLVLFFLKTLQAQQFTFGGPESLIAIESLIPSDHLVLCHPLLLLPSIFPSIRVFPNESALHIRWPKYWSFSFSISPSSEYSGLISFRLDWFGLLAGQGTPENQCFGSVQTWWGWDSFSSWGLPGKALNYLWLGHKRSDNCLAWTQIPQCM